MQRTPSINCCNRYKTFKFEGRKRMEQAEKGIALLQKSVDAIITIPNQNVLNLVDKKANIQDAFL